MHETLTFCQALVWALGRGCEHEVPAPQDTEEWRSWEPTQRIIRYGHGVTGVPGWDQTSLFEESRKWISKAQDLKGSGGLSLMKGNSVGKGPIFEWETASRSLVFIAL